MPGPAAKLTALFLVATAAMVTLNLVPGLMFPSVHAALFVSYEVFTYEFMVDARK